MEKETPKGERRREFRRVHRDWRQLDLFITDLQSAKRKRRFCFLQFVVSTVIASLRVSRAHSDRSGVCGLNVCAYCFVYSVQSFPGTECRTPLARARGNGVVGRGTATMNLKQDACAIFKHDWCRSIGGSRFLTRHGNGIAALMRWKVRYIVFPIWH